MSPAETIAALESAGWPYAAVLASAVNDPTLVLGIAKAVIRSNAKLTSFLDASLSFLPPKDFPPLVQFAMEHLRGHPDQENEALESVLSVATLQNLESLSPYLRELWNNNPMAASYYGTWPRRGADDLEIARLKRLVMSPGTQGDTRRDALMALLETRREEVLRWALATPHKESAQWLAAETGLVGGHGGLSHLCPEACFHLLFPRTYRPQQLQWTGEHTAYHPTWNPQDGAVHETEFGGRAPGTCSSCGKGLHRLLKLSHHLAELGVSHFPTLEISTCLSCLGWERDELHCKHGANGEAMDLDPAHDFVEAQFPSAPLREAKCTITSTPPRWRWQGWGLSNGRENLNRLGGNPCWVQSAQYPDCRGCGSTMHFLMQLDGELPLQGEPKNEHDWGSGGLCYVIWCDTCKHSALHWQCT